MVSGGVLAITFALLLAGVVGSIVPAVATGPLGLLIGVPVTVFLLELYRNGDSGRARHAALVTTVGIFASTLVQALLTTTLLVGFALVILL